MWKKVLPLKSNATVERELTMPHPKLISYKSSKEKSGTMKAVRENSYSRSIGH